MKKAIILAALLPLWGATGAGAQAPAAASAKGDAAAGKAKASAICSGCHGVPGTKAAYPSVYLVPKIGGQNADYIVAALKAYKSGERYNETMKALATQLSDKDTLDVAAYYAQK
ncbi:MAG: c-type cytochrome [Betaproteobacteria bacterium]|nr:c-type cytochrome [Betaproteobacteria bacterium]